MKTGHHPKAKQKTRIARLLVTALRELIAGPRGGPPEQDGLKLVLMSATLDANLFCGYFGGIERCPLVHVEGRAHPINDYYLEDLLYATGVVRKELRRLISVTNNVGVRNFFGLRQATLILEVQSPWPNHSTSLWG